MTEHSGIEKADEFASYGLCTPYMFPEPAARVTKSLVTELEVYWDNIGRSKQWKTFIRRPPEKRTEEQENVSWLRIIIGLHTGYDPFRGHQNKI